MGDGEPESEKGELNCEKKNGKKNRVKRAIHSVERPE